MKKLIHITENDITHGTRMHCTACPVSRAISRHLNKPSGCATATMDTVIFAPKGKVKSIHVPLPTVAQTFIKMFDCAEIVKPFNFYLEIPNWALKNGRTSTKTAS